MYLDRLLRRVAELDEIGTVQLDGVEGCTGEEVAELEAKLGVRLPGVLREFFLWGGKECSEVFDSYEVAGYEDQVSGDLRGDAESIMSEAGEDPAVLKGAVVVQMDYDGQFGFVRTDEGEDPPVYFRNELGPVKRACERYSDYLRLILEQDKGGLEIEVVDSEEKLGELAAGRRHQVQHVMFGGEMQFGTIPEEVFEFKELRSLSVVGCGLMEVAGRISELGFLRRLELARNSLTTLPMALGELDELEELDLSENQLSTVIGVLRKLPALKSVCLRGNLLEAEEVEEIRNEMRGVELDLGGGETSQVEEE